MREGDTLVQMALAVVTCDEPWVKSQHPTVIQQVTPENNEELQNVSILTHIYFKRGKIFKNKLIERLKN